MPKVKKVKEDKNIYNEQKSMEEEIINDFILHREAEATYDPFAPYSFPLMMRLDRDHVAKLDHLAESWRTKRSNLAGKMLEEMIDLVMRRYYKEKTEEEYNMILREVWDEFDKKLETAKKKKEKK